MPSAVRLREDYSAGELRGWPAGRKTSTRADGFSHWQGFETERAEGRRGEDRGHGTISRKRTRSAGRLGLIGKDT
jgi:hypothetical protein